MKTFYKVGKKKKIRSSVEKRVWGLTPAPSLQGRVLLLRRVINCILEAASQAAKNLDGKSDSRYISRYINLERPVIVGQEKTPVYFVMNPD